MPAEMRSIPILLAIVISLILHVTTALIVAQRPLPLEPTAQAHLSPPEDAPNPLRLGIERSTSTTAIAWIGYDTFRAMNAPESSIDQAGQTADQPMPTVKVTPPTPPPSMPTEAEMRTLAQAASRSVTEAQAATQQVAQDIINLARSLAGTLRLPIAAKTSSDRANPADTQSPTQDQVIAAAPKTPPAPKTPLSMPPPAEPGHIANREAPPTTTLPDIDSDDLGHPIAASGLEIHTVRPRFSHYMELTADPKDPLVRIHFDRGGKVRKVELVESTGYRAVDEPISTAVYRWRATGEALQTLPVEKPEQGLIVELRILL